MGTNIVLRCSRIVTDVVWKEILLRCSRIVIDVMWKGTGKQEHCQKTCFQSSTMHSCAMS